MSDQIVSSKWKTVDKNYPCQECEKTDWCSYTEDGSVHICRREGNPNAREKIDKSGATYWLYGTPNKQVQTAIDHADRAETPPHTVEVRDVAYRALLDGLPLDDKHKPFPEAEALGYRTCPGAAGETKAGTRIFKAIGAKGRLDHLKIPGAKIKKIEVDGKEVERATITSWEGFYLPCRDHLGHVAALMVRRDEDPRLKPDAKSTSKYVWFRGDQHGSTTGQVPHVPTSARKIREEQGEALTPANEVIRITEGVKKADVGTLRTPIVTVAYPTASSWQLAWGPIQEITNELGHTEVRQVVRHAPDADARTNKAVCGGVVRAISHCIIMGRTPELEAWDPAKGKGFDDVLLAHGESIIDVVRGAKMFDVLIEWCQSSGYPVPEELTARALLYRVETEMEGNGDRVLDIEVAHAMVILAPYSDMGETLKRITEVGSLRGRKTKFEANLKEAHKARKEKAKAEKEAKIKAIALRNSGREDMPTFYRGDHVEIAQQLREELGSDVIFEEGAYWRYAPGFGIWSEIYEEELWDIVTSYAGAPCDGKPLKLKAHDISGTLKVTERAMRKRGFFEGARPGFTFSNGFVVVDEKGVHLEKHGSNHRVRLAYDFAFEPDADCPKFKAFLREILLPNATYPMSTDDQERVDREVHQRMQYILEHFGLSLVGEATRLAGKVLILLGDGANGKSTLTEVIESIFPPKSICGVAPHDWTNDQKVMLLKGKLLNIVGELPSKDLEQTDRYKGITTGDQWITGKNVYEKPTEFKSTAGHTVNANVLMASGDSSHGFARRNAVIYLHRVFLDYEQDRGLKAKLLAERAGIVKLLLESAQAALARGTICDVPETSLELLEKWRASSDPVRLWIQRKCLLSWDVTQCGELPKAAQLEALYKEYCEWAKSDNRWALTSSTFEDRLLSILRDLAREDLSLIYKHWNVALEPPLLTDLRFGGYTHADDCEGGEECSCTAPGVERAAAKRRLEKFLANGELRQKVDGSSVRRLPMATAAMRHEAEVGVTVGAL